MIQPARKLVFDCMQKRRYTVHIGIYIYIIISFIYIYIVDYYGYGHAPLPGNLTVRRLADHQVFFSQNPSKNLQSTTRSGWVRRPEATQVDKKPRGTYRNWYIITV